MDNAYDDYLDEMDDELTLMKLGEDPPDSWHVNLAGQESELVEQFTFMCRQYQNVLPTGWNIWISALGFLNRGVCVGFQKQARSDDPILGDIQIDPNSGIMPIFCIAGVSTIAQAKVMLDKLYMGLFRSNV